MRHRGFTIIELLVKLSILSVLLYIVWPSYQRGINERAVETVANDIQSVLNSTLGAWQASGGVISGSATAAQVLTVLTSTPGQNISISNPGLGSSGTVSLVADGGTSNTIRLPNNLINSLGLTGTTSSNIVYFDNGRYTISFDNQNLSFTVSVTSGENTNSASSGGGGLSGCGGGSGSNSQPSAGLGDFVLAGVVFADNDNDGIQASGESGIAQTTVNLSGSTSLQATSDTEGGFAFKGLLPGTYQINVIQPDGYLPGISRVGTLGGNVSNGTINDIIIENSPGLAYTFAFIEPASLTGLAYVDLNEDGQPQSNETRLVDVVFEITGTNDLDEFIYANASTDDEGIFTFSSIRPGTYSLSADTPSGYEDGIINVGNAGGTIISSGIANIALEVQEAATGYIFGFTLLENTPDAPDNITVTQNSNGGVNIQWNDNSSNETGFIVERSTGNGVWTEVGQPTSNSTSYADTTAEHGESYTYRVRAINSQGSSTSATSGSIIAQNPSTLVPSTGFTQSTSQPDAIGEVTDYGYNAKAIARWDVVPFQTFNNTFNVGVTAFHINGIDRVEFSVNGGPWSAVRKVALNPQTNVVEYWAKLRASDFSDGLIEVRAIVYPTIGEPRVLAGALTGTTESARGEHSMYLNANANGTLPSAVRYVSTTGNDSNDGLTPQTAMATTNRAAHNITQTQGNSDGATIYLLPGSYTLSGAAWNTNSVTVNRWMTIMPAPGVNRDEVTILGTTGSGFNSKLVKLQGVTMTGGANSGGPLEDYVWLHDVLINGPGRDVGTVGMGNWTGRYVTNSTFTNVSDAATTYRLVRDVLVEVTGGDSFSNSGIVINSISRDLDPAGMTGVFHPDVYQNVGYADNVILYGITANESIVGAQGLAFNFPPANVAIIDCDIAASWLLNYQYTNIFVRGSNVFSTFGSSPNFTYVVYEDVTFYGNTPNPVTGVIIR